MAARSDNYRLFLREYWRNFHSTGAVLPSSQSLCRALVRFVHQSPGPKRILEAGPGTGTVTRRIAAAMGPHDRLDLVEVNDQFVRHLRGQLATAPEFQQIADRVELVHGSLEAHKAAEPYDVIISGLPLNNFSVQQVQQVLGSLRAFSRPGGSCSFFEYIGIRKARLSVSGPAGRARIRAIDRQLRDVLKAHEFDRDAVWWNVPPAWVHHLRLHKEL